LLYMIIKFQYEDIDMIKQRRYKDLLMMNLRKFKCFNNLRSTLFR